MVFCLLLAVALAQDTGAGGASGMGAGGSLGGLGGGSWEPPPPPEVAPLGKQKDVYRERLPELARIRLGKAVPADTFTGFDYLVQTPAGVAVGDGHTIVLFDADGRPRGRVEASHRGLAVHDGRLLLLGGAGVRATATLPHLDVTVGDTFPDEPFPQFISLGLSSSKPRFPTRPSVAAGGDVVAHGLDTLTVTVGAAVYAYDLVDQVHLTLRDPAADVFGAVVGGSPREVDPAWDPANVRPQSLHLEDVSVSADGRRVAMLWTYLVIDAYGDDRQFDWLSVLDPYKNGLAGRVVPSSDHVALSADGTRVLAYGSHSASGFTLPPPEPLEAPPRTEAPTEASPEPVRVPPSASSDTLGALAEIDPRVLEVLGSAGEVSGVFGTTDPFGRGSRLRQGKAQPLPTEQQFSVPSIQGYSRRVALSADGRLLAVGTEKETALVRVGESEPLWRYDLGQGGTTGLVFGADTLWVLGADTTVLGIPLPPQATTE